MKNRSTIVQSMNPEMLLILHRLGMYIKSRMIGFPIPKGEEMAVFTKFMAANKELQAVLREEIKEDDN